MTEPERTCRGCQEVLPIERFPPDKRGRAGRSPRCQPCKLEMGRAASLRNYHRQTPEQRAKVRRRQRQRLAMRNHGSEGLRVHERREAGEGCDICGRCVQRMAVDHSHETGKVRGLLCPRCNTVLGSCEDDIELLGAMISYLAKWKPHAKKAKS